jgi:hypothetical protein
MSVEIFTKQQFENSLPKHKRTGENLWKYAGLDKGEHCYWVTFGSEHAHIFVRSSVKANGTSAGTGEDSIRCWLCEPESKLPLAKKLVKWTTRVTGWERRLVDLLRKIAVMGFRIKPCPSCGIPLRIVKIGKGSNEGKLALSCSAKKSDGSFANHFFEVMEE